jgi:putative membrane protein
VDPAAATAHDLDGMRAAAQLMYYGGDLAELALAVALFATWFRALPIRQEDAVDHRGG